MQADPSVRDTDADWRELGASQPYWGVITHPDYRTENLTDQALDAFYASGVHYIDDIAGRLEQATGHAPKGQALDFGCGTGRLAEAMARRAMVTGYDISPGMLEKARARQSGVAYCDILPDGPFDWINSYIVLQHIPPTRGMGLIGDLLARLAPGGQVSLHLTVWREDHLVPASATGWRAVVRRVLPRTPPSGTISMYDYDLSAVCRLLNRAGVTELTLVETDHGGHHGVIILGRKTGGVA